MMVIDKDLMCEKLWYLSSFGASLLRCYISNNAKPSELKDRHKHYFSDIQDLAVNGNTGLAYTFGNVGILEIFGILKTRGNSNFYTSYDRLIQDFLSLESNPEINSIVLALDTPGGAVTGVSEFADIIKQSKKYVVAHPMGLAASAGYYIASQADKVIAVNQAEVGSIGAIATYMDMSEALKKEGINIIEIVSEQSPNKLPDLMTEEGRSGIQSLVNESAYLFEQAVAEGRGITVDDVRQNYGQGAEFIAHEALSRGMIDSISYTKDLLIDLLQYKKEKIGEKNMNEKSDNVDIQTILQNERNRIASIERLADQYSESDERIRMAVKKEIDTIKYEDGISIEAAEYRVSRVAYSAQTLVLDEWRNKNKPIKLINDVDTSEIDEDRIMGKSKQVAKNLAAIITEAGRLI